MNLRLLKRIISGFATYVPGVYRLRHKETLGTDTSRYCYSVWLRHLVMAHKNGLNSRPQNVAELGPGDSLGIGLAALLSGAERYWALDVIEYANSTRNIKIFEELLDLFKKRERIPDGSEFPEIKPPLDNYDFPAEILDETRLEQALDPLRIRRIRDALNSGNVYDSPISYKAPWSSNTVLARESVDMIYSQAVLEHVDDLKETYRAMNKWLRPEGFVSHQIDFSSHGTADQWNGHWRYSDFIWQLIRGNRPYLINREPHSTHVAILHEENYRLVCDLRAREESVYVAGELAPRFRKISEEDLTTRGAFIQAVKG